MTTLDESVLTDPMNQGNAVPPTKTARPAAIVCSSYRDAKYLAASQRRSHLNRDAHAAYDQVLASWCVR